MTSDAGIQEIMGRYAPAGPGIGLDAEAELSVQVGGLVAEMRAERQRRTIFEQRLSQAIRAVPLVSVTAAAAAPAVFASPDWVCKTSYSWAVQTITAKGLGATDTVWVYRTSGSGTAEVVDSAAKNLLTAAAPVWHPGRTGLVLQPGDGITVQGTITATVTVNIDVIVLESWIVPDFLL